MIRGHRLQVQELKLMVHGTSFVVNRSLFIVYFLRSSVDV